MLAKKGVYAAKNAMMSQEECEVKKEIPEISEPAQKKKKMSPTSRKYKEVRNKRVGVLKHLINSIVIGQRSVLQLLQKKPTDIDTLFIIKDNE